MQFLRTNPDLSAKAKLKPIGKTGRGIHIYCGGIYLLLESAGIFIITGHNGFGMFGTEPIDMLNCFSQAVNDFDG